MGPVFQKKIEECLGAIADRVTVCMKEAQSKGEIPKSADPRHLANLFVDCWEGAALRSRLRQDPAPLNSMLNFYFSAVIPKIKKAASKSASQHP